MSGVEKTPDVVRFTFENGESVGFQHSQSLQKLEKKVKEEWVSLPILGKSASYVMNADLVLTSVNLWLS